MTSAQERKDQLIRQRAADREFGDREVVEYLDGWDVGTLTHRYGEPVVTTHYASATGWRQGDPRPALSTDDPAVMAAIGRCASWRQRERLLPVTVPGWVHPAECGWCGYPLAEMVAACSWSVWASRHVLSEGLAWVGKDGSSYARGGRQDVYENPRWLAFAALTSAERRTGVEQAIATSRE